MNSLQKTLLQQVPPDHTDPRSVWNGTEGTVDIKGMRFRVSTETGTGGRQFQVVRVLCAPLGTEFHSISGSNFYVSVPLIHASKFPSGLPEYTKLIWDFFDRFYRKVGVKSVRGNPEKRNAFEGASNSVDALIAKKEQRYCFEENAPRAALRLEYRPYGHGLVPVIELVYVEKGHPLHGCTRPRTYVFYSLIVPVDVPSFAPKGGRAGDQYKLWEYVRDVVFAHRKKTKYSNVIPLRP